MLPTLASLCVLCPQHLLLPLTFMNIADMTEPAKVNRRSASIKLERSFHRQNAVKKSPSETHRPLYV